MANELELVDCPVCANRPSGYFAGPDWNCAMCGRTGKVFRQPQLHEPPSPKLAPAGNLREIAHRLMGKWACEGEIIDAGEGEHSLICDTITANLAKEIFR